MIIWAQLENAGGRVTGAQVEFRVVRAGTGDAWAAHFGDLTLEPGDRSAWRLGWDVGGEDPTARAYEVRVIDGATGDVLASTQAPIPFEASPLGGFTLAR
jgi:hypothetical protein